MQQQVQNCVPQTLQMSAAFPGPAPPPAAPFQPFLPPPPPPPHHPPNFHPQQLPLARHPPPAHPRQSRQAPMRLFPPQNGLLPPPVPAPAPQHQNYYPQQPPNIHLVPIKPGNAAFRQQPQVLLPQQQQQLAAAAFVPANLVQPAAHFQYANGPSMQSYPQSATFFVPNASMESSETGYHLHQPFAVHGQGAMLPMPFQFAPMALHHASPSAMAAAHAHPPPPGPPPAQHPQPPGHGQQMLGTKGEVPNTVENAAAVAGVDCWSTAVTGWEQAAMIKNKIGLLINGRFRIMQSIASGSYGEIFTAEDLHSPGPKKQRVAVKFDGACRDNHLRYEYEVYKSVLYEDGNGKVEGFPQVYSWSHEYGHNVMVMELLGAPVASLFAFCDRKFARQTIVSLGDQMIQRIRHLHQRGFIHRDVKPENFLMGLAGKESTLYLIDFGLARRYRFREGENRTLTHIPYRRGRSFIGTAKYASLNSHKNIELSRRDDLESLAYVLIELVNGHLPWKNISKRNATTRHQASQRIRQLKEQTNWEDFCPSMARFMRYCREISFSDEPDYDKLLDLLQLIALPEHSLSIQSSMFFGGKYQNMAQRKDYGSVGMKRASTAVCCQTLETAEKLTQVNLEEPNGQEEREGQGHSGTAKQEGEEEESVNAITKYVVQSMQRQLSLTVAENASDFDEIGAATTTTSCSENEELDMATGEGVLTRSGTGTADDEGSQPTAQQEQQQICRKCRRLRDQTQKRAKGEEQESGPKQRVDTGLQTDSQAPAQVQKKPLEQRKMCWQRARESNAERRFQYENKFSWTLPIPAEPGLVAPYGAILGQPPPPNGQQQPRAILQAPALSLLPPAASTAQLAGPSTGFNNQSQPPAGMPLIAALVHPPVPNGHGGLQPALLQIDPLQHGTSSGAFQPILLAPIPAAPMPLAAIQQQNGGEQGRRALQVAFVLPPPMPGMQRAGRC